MAARLRIPYSRWYDAMIQKGLRKTEDMDDVLVVLTTLQQGAVSFSSLAENFGREITLGDLADYEAAAFVEGTVSPRIPKLKPRKPAEEGEAAEA